MDFLLIFTMATFVLRVVRSQEPEITENILPVVRRQGVQGRLSCVVINQMTNPVYWIHKPTQTTLSENEKIVIDDANNEVLNGWPKYMIERAYDGEKVIYTIIINRLEARNSGLYTCQIMVRGTDRYPSKDGEMVVLTPPSILQSSTSHTESVKEGGSFNLTCGATGHPLPNITWVRVNGVAFPNGKLQYHGSSLGVQNATRHDRGVYRCLADNYVRPPARHDITLNVFFRPHASAVQSTYGQAENRMLDVTIECRIAGWPDPNLQWFKVKSGGNRAPIQNNDKYSVNVLLSHANMLQSNERWFQLVIHSVQANDYGDYACEGTNGYGTGFAIVYLFATSECQGANCPPESYSSDDVSSLAVCHILLVAMVFISACWMLAERH